MASTDDIPAIEGGTPVREHYLPYSRQWIDDSDRQAVLQVLQETYLTTGPTISLFEQKVAEYVGAKYAVAFANGTAALHAACFTAGIHRGDEVITTPLTFAASANAILYTNGKPVFADIDLKTYTISPENIELLITDRTKAIIPVDYAGHPVNPAEIKRIAKKYGLTIIEDAAHALGATYAGNKVGSFSDMTMFSFHPVKSITTGEGGMITTNHKEYYERLRQFRAHGITRDPNACKAYEGPWYYEMQFLGFNYRMTDIQAALGISQLKRLDTFIARRGAIANQYQAAFSTLSAVIPPYQAENAASAWHLYVIRLAQEQLTVVRKKIFEALLAENIGVNVHYIPVYLHPYYQSLGYQRGLCPVAEMCYETMITLPLFPAMTDQDVHDVISAVRKVIQFYSK